MKKYYQLTLTENQFFILKDFIEARAKHLEDPKISQHFTLPEIMGTQEIHREFLAAKPYGKIERKDRHETKSKAKKEK